MKGKELIITRQIIGEAISEPCLTMCATIWRLREQLLDRHLCAPCHLGCREPLQIPRRMPRSKRAERMLWRAETIKAARSRGRRRNRTRMNLKPMVGPNHCYISIASTPIAMMICANRPIAHGYATAELEDRIAARETMWFEGMECRSRGERGW